MKGGGWFIHPSIQLKDREIQHNGVNCPEIDLMRICKKGRAPCERNVMKHLGFSCSAQKHAYSTITCSTERRQWNLKKQYYSMPLEVHNFLLDYHARF